MKHVARPKTSIVAVTALLAISGGLLTCAAASPAQAQAAAQVTAQGGDSIRAVCRQMIAQHLGPVKAARYARDRGYTTRIGTVDGVPRAVTMDYREDRLTLTITKGRVTACVVG